MLNMEISKELKNEIEFNQDQLKNAICNHQEFLLKAHADPDNLDLQKAVGQADEQIILIGLEQKALLAQLRRAYNNHRNLVDKTITKNGLQKHRHNLTTALNRARKQNIIIRSSPTNPFSDEDSGGTNAVQLPQEDVFRPVDPHEMPQADFLGYFNLGSHELYKELQNKRAERKRRSTANPHFLYGATMKGWEHMSKRKRGYLISAFSPPNTRQAVKKRAERVSPPPAPPVVVAPPEKSIAVANEIRNGNTNNNNTVVVVKPKPSLSPFPSIPNLPSGLIIERVSPGSSSPDSKSCITCKQPGLLVICEVCASGFHISCHNRPLAQTPRQCPRCISNKKIRTIGSLSVPSGMSVSYVTPSEVSEKLQMKMELHEKHRDLAAELTQLQDRHSQLVVSLKSQSNQQEQLLSTRQSTESKIQQILTFINALRSSSADGIEAH